MSVAVSILLRVDHECRLLPDIELEPAPSSEPETDKKQKQDEEK
jgi:cell division protein FtsW